MCYKAKPLLLLLLLFPIFVCGQNAKFRWVTESCEYEGTFDTKKYTSVQIENTYKLWFSSYFRLETDATSWTISGIDELSVDKLETEYQQKHAELVSLDIVDQKLWHLVRQKRLDEMNQLYKLKRLTILGYSRPAVLKEFVAADSCVNRYVQGLEEGGELLLKSWEALNRQHRKRNGFPERIEEKFLKEFDSPEKYKYAQVEIMQFGWWNCANGTINYVSSGNSEKMFNKLFNKIKTIECDDVD